MSTFEKHEFTKDEIQNQWDWLFTIGECKEIRIKKDGIHFYYKYFYPKGGRIIPFFVHCWEKTDLIEKLSPEESTRLKGEWFQQYDYVKNAVNFMCDTLEALRPSHFGFKKRLNEYLKKHNIKDFDAERIMYLTKHPEEIE